MKSKRRSFRVNNDGKITEYTIINNDKEMIDCLGWDLSKAYTGNNKIIIDELIETEDDYINKQFIIDDLKSYNDFIAMLDNINVQIIPTKHGFIVKR